MFATPVVAGDQLLVSSCEGWFFSISLDSGAEQWRYDTKKASALQCHSEMLVLDDRVIVGTDGRRGNGHALDLATGEELWTYPSGTALRVDLKQFEDTVIGVAKRDDIDELFCLAIEDGAPRWTVDHARKGAKAYRNTPAIVGDRVYFGSADGIVSYDVRTGERHDSIDVGGAVSTSLLVVDHYIYAGVGDDIVRVDMDTGEVDGRFDTGGAPIGKPALLGDSIAVLVDWRKRASRLLALDQALDTVRWQWRPEDRSDFGTIARLRIIGGDVVVGTEGGRVFALDVDDGTMRWEIKVDGAVRSAGFHEGVMYVGTIPGKVHAIEMPSR